MTMNRRVVLTGATGFIGGAVARELINRGYQLVVFSRNPGEARRKVLDASEYVAWQPEESGEWAMAIDGAYAVIHCAAPSIFAKRHTKAFARETLGNRITSTRGLVTAMAGAKQRPAVFISSSSQGIYGFGAVSGDSVDESFAIGTDSWGEESRLWEAEALKAEALGIRTVLMRTGFVLGAEGEGLPGVVERIGAGRGGVSKPESAYCSWIHIADEARLYLFSLEEERVRGPLNGVAPSPVTNREYAEALGRALGRPVGLSPYFVTRLFVGKVAEVFARQRRIIPRKALDLGFSFEYATLEWALADLVPRILAPQAGRR